MDALPEILLKGYYDHPRSSDLRTREAHKNGQATATHRETGRRLENGTRTSEVQRGDYVEKVYSVRSSPFGSSLPTHYLLPCNRITSALDTAALQHEPYALFRLGCPQSSRIPSTDPLRHSSDSIGDVCRRQGYGCCGVSLESASTRSLDVLKLKKPRVTRLGDVICS
jgi:hypothetical protein